jgi:hypothetical protein
MFNKAPAIHHESIKEATMVTESDVEEHDLN